MPCIEPSSGGAQEHLVECPRFEAARDTGTGRGVEGEMGREGDGGRGRRAHAHIQRDRKQV